MTTRKTARHKGSLSIVFALFCILGLALLPQRASAQMLRLVYNNDNLGELSPCG